MLVNIMHYINENSSVISIVAILLSCISIIICLLGKKVEDHNFKKTPLEVTIACVIMVVIIGVTGLCISILLLKQVDEKAVDQLVNMQGITLAITGAAISLISIIATLQNYDHERKGKEIEERLNNELNTLKEKINKSIEVQNNKLNKQGKSLDENIKELGAEIVLLQKGIFAQFMNELQKSYGSVAGKYFYDQFDEYRENVKAIEQYLPDLSKIEMNMNKIMDCYVQNNKDQIRDIFEKMYGTLTKDINGDGPSCKLVQLYFETRLADFMFYAKEDDSTIDRYYHLMETCKGQEPTKEKLMVYYANCVIWLLTKHGKHDDERIEKSIEVFCDKNNQDHMIPTYYRNWGVWLERKGKIEIAKRKYEKAISIIHKEPNEYKVFVTYVSSVIKLYRESYQDYGKWLEDENREEELRKCKAYLEYAKLKNPLFVDTYIKGILLNSFMLIFQSGQIGGSIYLSVIKEDVENDYAMKSLFTEEDRRFDEAWEFYQSVCRHIVGLTG